MIVRMAPAQSVQLTALQRQLQAFAKRLEEGLDIAPTQRANAEGFAAALLASGIDCEWLRHYCEQWLPMNNCMRIALRDGAMVFDCWQRRAPVFPSTRD